MRCPACGGENVDGSKFCGACGARLAGPTLPPDVMAVRVPPNVTGETRRMPSGGGAGQSMGESMVVPGGGRGGRKLMIGAVLAVDVGLVIGGIVLMATPRKGNAEKVAMTTVGGGSQAGAAGGSGSGGGGGSAGSGSAGTGTGTGTGVTHTGSAGTGTGSGSGSGSSASTGSGSGSVTSAVDAAVAAPPQIDAAVAAPPEVDAAVAAPPEVDAAAQEAVSAQEIANYLARLVVSSNARLERCYETATKVLPADQPLVGEVDISLTVMPTGAAQNVAVSRNTTGSNDLGDCVLAIAKSWTFPPHDETEPISFVRPFHFGPQ